jgi:hypothetical protein
MLTIKWTQPSGAISIQETKNACTLIPKTKAWEEYKKENPDIITDKIRALVMHDGGTICVFICEAHLYIVNENGKTVQTV